MKKTKIPKIFRKQYSQKKLNKKILKRIHIPRDRELISNLFVENSQGKMEITSEIPEELLSKLKPLSKSVKKNKGLVSTWKAAVILILIFSLLIFNFFFKDNLIKKAAESGLESIFKAEVEMVKPRFSIFKGVLSYQSLTIADADQPMANLIETGRARIIINMAELTRKRIHIEDMSLEEVKWNTSRTADGSINKDPSDMDSGSSDGAPIISADDFNYQVLLEEQKDQLKSLKVLDQSNGQIEEMSNRWSGQIEENRNDISQLNSKIDEVRSINVNDIGSVNEAQDAIKQIQSLYSQVDELKRDLNSLNNSFISDKKQIINLKNSIPLMIDEDISYLNGLLDFSTGNLQSIASGLAEDYIRNRWNNYYDFGLKALKIYNRFGKKETDESEKNKGLNRDSGRIIPFPTPDNPEFLMNRAFLSGGDDKTGQLTMEVQSIASEPDKVPEPLRFRSILAKDNSSIELDGYIDNRTGSVRLFEMNILSPGNPVELDRGIPSLSISRITSISDLNGQSLIIKGDDVLTTEMNITLGELQIEQIDSDSLLSKTVSDLFSGVQSIELTGELDVGLEGIKKLSIESDFDNLLNDSLGDYLSELDDTIINELEKNLLSYISPELENNELLVSSLDSLGVQSLDQISSVEAMENTLDKKMADIENRSSSFIESESKKVLENVKDKIKLPGF